MPHYDVSHVEYDELCDLPTMTYFRRYAGNYIRAGRSKGHDVYVVYLNLENFSLFNERYGFEEGDGLLRLTSVAIQTAFPGYLVSRVSGDRFLIVCESLDVEDAILDVRQQLHVYGRHANVEVKAGIFRIPDEDVNTGLACDYAKIACDSIAHRYDRTFRWYDEALAWRVERKQYIESHIDQAIENGWIQVFFQPIVRTITGKVCEYEALARWDDPRYGFLSPAVFVDVLEEGRLIHKLDACVIRQVCEEWHKFEISSDWRVPVSVNLSRFDFELCDVFEMVDGLAKEYDVPRQMLHIEVTESALIESSTLLGNAIERFRDAGYQVWMDDFGSGYSSLNTLKDYVFDVVKIDMVFLREFDSKPKSRTIIASVVNMAKQLGMQTLIEGVETPEQFDFVRSIGCEFAQGYLIGRPSTSKKNVERIFAGELVMEHVSMHGYYDRIGSVNALSANPFDFPWDSSVRGRPFAEVLPLAVIEFQDDVISMMSSSNAFAQVIENLHVGTVAAIVEAVNRRGGLQARAIYEVIVAAANSSSTESVDLMVNGMHCVFRARYIASYKSVNALLVSLMSFPRFSDATEERLAQIATRSLYSTYDEVNIVDLSDGTVNTLYRGNSWFPSMSAGQQISAASSEFAQRHVHPDDRERFVSFVDVSKLLWQEENAIPPSMAEAFRVLNPSGTYEWITVTLIPLDLGDSHTVLECIRPVNAEVCSTIADEQYVSKSLLWDTLLDLIPVGVFWKDEDRRFLGANRTFLEYYELDSVNELLGKNDEDMGWHVEADPYKDDELKVVEYGESIFDAPGTCIARGEVRDILANKVPLRRNGRIVGLLGYFIDAKGHGESSRRNAKEAFEGHFETDALTGISNLRGMMLSIAAYHKAYEVTGIRYVAVVASLRGMSNFKHIYGHEFGDRVLQTVSRRLVRLYGVSGAIARIGEENFAALRQISTAEDACAEADRLCCEVEGIREVDGIAVNLRCEAGWAINTEVKNMDDVLYLAEQRLYDMLDKESHA